MMTSYIPNNNVEENNVITVIINNRCTGCGTCVSICPKYAISMPINEKKGVYEPKINLDSCINCGQCLNVCPGLKLSEKSYHGKLKDLKQHDLLGDYYSCFLGHANDYTIRYHSASGGLATALLISALERKVIDGALVTKMNQNSPWQPESFLARTKEEIIAAATSKYCPVPLNISLNKILDKPIPKIAVVGLPCHIAGIRAIMKINKEFREAIVFCLGIFCSHTNTFHGMNYLLKKLGIDPQEIKELSYRSGGWPGGIQVITRDGRSYFLDNTTALRQVFQNSAIFAPLSCLYCSDVTCEEADISLGDPWLPEMKWEHIGKSIIVCRTQTGQNIISEALATDIITLEKISSIKVIKSQQFYLHFKKINLNYRLKGNPQTHSLTNRIMSYITTIGNQLGRSLSGRRIIFYLPAKFLARPYYTIHRFYKKVIVDDFNHLYKPPKMQYKDGKKTWPNFLILHAHWNNRGDEAAVRAMLNALTDAFPKCNLILLFPFDEEFPDDRATIIKAYPIGLRKFIAFFDVLITIISWGKYSLTLLGKQFLHTIDKADFVIHAPGGPSIGDYYGGKFGELIYLYRLFMAKIVKKKPLAFYAPSMGPFNKKSRNWLRKIILKNADILAVREPISANYLHEKFGLNAIITADSALQNDIDVDAINWNKNLLKSYRWVGMVITDLKWHPIYKKEPEIGEKIIASFIELSEYLLAKGYYLLLIPQLFSQQNDIHILDKVAMHLNNPAMVKILPPDIDAIEQQSIIGKLFCIVSARYHPVIFATKVFTPVIPVYYEHKTEGFINKVGISEYSIHVRKINGQKLIELFNMLEKDHDVIQEHFRSIRGTMRALASRTTELIIEKLSKSDGEKP